MASFFAIIGTLPLVMFYFNQISLVGLCANFIIVPLIGFVVVPLGLLSVFLYPLTISGSLVCLKAGAFVLAQALGIVNFIAELPFAAVKTVTPTYFEVCCFYVLFWAVLNLKRIRPEASAGQNNVQSIEHRASGQVFIHKSAALVAMLVVLVFSADACYWLYNRFWHDDFRITIIDVGNGNAALLELPKGYNILLDGGGFSDNSVFDIGARIIAPVLWRKKIKTVDTLILSHPNSDHLNGLIYIAEHFNVKNVWTNNERANTLGYKKFVEVIEKNKIQMPGYKGVTGIHDINGVRLDIFYPPVDFINKREQERWRNLNNNSLVLKASFGSKSFLFPGDIKVRAEYELVSTAGDRLKSTVLLAPHHGSKTSSTKAFLEKVDPEIVIISSGWKSRFGFPHPSVVEKYNEQGCRILGTALNGAITMSTDGQTLKVRPTIINEFELFARRP
jgi:competence protein ComEC